MQLETTSKCSTSIKTLFNETHNDDETSTDDDCGSPLICCGSSSQIVESKKTASKISLSSLVPINLVKAMKFTMKDLSAIEAEINSKRNHSNSPVPPLRVLAPLRKANSEGESYSPEIKLVKPKIVRRSYPAVVPCMGIPERSCNAMCNDKQFGDL